MWNSYTVIVIIILSVSNKMAINDDNMIAIQKDVCKFVSKRYFDYINGFSYRLINYKNHNQSHSGLYNCLIS